MKRLLGILAVSAFVLPGAARAQVLTFEGIGNPATQTWAIGNFYDGGGGPNYGIDFSTNALRLCLNTLTVYCSNTSRGGLGDPNSQNGGLFFLDNSFTYMNSNSGFTSGFSFYYVGINTGGSFAVYSGLNGTGSQLAFLSLARTPSSCLSGYNAGFCPFFPEGVSFSGTAQSVVFAGVANQIVFDDVTFGSSTPGNVVPEPASLVLLATGLFGIGGVGIARRLSIG